MELTLLTLLGVGAIFALFEAFNDDDDDDSSPDLTGTEAADTLSGSEGGETITGLGGDDTIRGNGGDDLLRGGDGDDLLSGGAGDDRIITDESLSVSEGGGVDVALGDAGDDVLRGGIETDILSGGDGNDLVVGDLGDDWLQGDAGDDTLEGRLGRDTLIGGDGSDTLIGGTGRDVLFGGTALLTPLSTEADLIGAREDFTDGSDALDVSFPGTGLIYAADDGSADTLDGGGSADLLFLGLGDTGTGGLGADTFHVLQDAGDGPAIVTDYDADVDTIAVLKESGAADPVLAIVDNGDGTTTLTADGDSILVTSVPLLVGDVVIIELGG